MKSGRAQHKPATTKTKSGQRKKQLWPKTLKIEMVANEEDELSFSTIIPVAAVKKEIKGNVLTLGYSILEERESTVTIIVPKSRGGGNITIDVSETVTFFFTNKKVEKIRMWLKKHAGKRVTTKTLLAVINWGGIIESFWRASNVLKRREARAIQKTLERLSGLVD